MARYWAETAKRRRNISSEEEKATPLGLRSGLRHVTSLSSEKPTTRRAGSGVYLSQWARFRFLIEARARGALE